VQKADETLTVVDAKMSKLEEMRLELAEFFCEDAKTFRLDDCIKTFHEFFDKFHKATQVCTWSSKKADTRFIFAITSANEHRF